VAHDDRAWRQDFKKSLVSGPWCLHYGERDLGCHDLSPVFGGRSMRDKHLEDVLRMLAASGGDAHDAVREALISGVRLPPGRYWLSAPVDVATVSDENY
jgi:hypothetical protein